MVLHLGHRTGCDAKGDCRCSPSVVAAKMARLLLPKLHGARERRRRQFAGTRRDPRHSDEQLQLI